MCPRKWPYLPLFIDLYSGGHKQEQQCQRSNQGSKGFRIMQNSIWNPALPPSNYVFLNRQLKSGFYILKEEEYLIG